LSGSQALRNHDSPFLAKFDGRPEAGLDSYSSFGEGRENFDITRPNGINIVFRSIRKTAQIQWLNGKGVTAIPPTIASGPTSGTKDVPLFPWFW
jgi:hypothetical protein